MVQLPVGQLRVLESNMARGAAFIRGLIEARIQELDPRFLPAQAQAPAAPQPALPAGVPSTSSGVASRPDPRLQSVDPRLLSRFHSNTSSYASPGTGSPGTSTGLQDPYQVGPDEIALYYTEGRFGPRGLTLGEVNSIPEV